MTDSIRKALEETITPFSSVLNSPSTVDKAVAYGFCLKQPSVNMHDSAQCPRLTKAVGARSILVTESSIQIYAIGGSEGSGTCHAPPPLWPNLWASMFMQARACMEAIARSLSVWPPPTHRPSMRTRANSTLLAALLTSKSIPKWMVIT